VRRIYTAGGGQLTGLTDVQIKRLAFCYAENKPAAILIGIGLQRHSNGGSTVRAIDALAALSGNIGVAGGGATYANFRISPQIDHAYLDGEDLDPQKRSFAKPQLAAALEELQDPPINFIYISRANPLVQVGDSGRLRCAMNGVPFIVTSEHFMTDTAAASDLVLPAAAFMEAEDLYFNSMSHQYLVYGSRIVAPAGECRPEYELFRELACATRFKRFS
jgi:anaerobic selenocysteine-containing dehydrogenase